MTGGFRSSKAAGSCESQRGGEGFLKEVFAMRRGSIGPKGGPALGALDEVMLRSKNTSAPVIGPGFMRRSCTFVTEGSWRKSSFGMGSGQKETKDKLNLALQVRKKAAQLGGCDEGAEEDDTVDSLGGSGRTPGRVSRLVGNLKSWSSSEDVRQSVVGALTRTVNVIKQRPGSRKGKPSGVTPGLGGKPLSAPTLNKNPKSKAGHIKNGPTTTSTPPASKASNNRPLANKTPIPKKKSAQEKGGKTIPNYMRPKATAKLDSNVPSDRKWLRHLHEAQNSYTSREGRNRRPHPTPNLPDPDLRDVEDGIEGENSESLDASVDCSSSRSKPQEGLDGSFNSSAAPPSVPQTPSSPETFAKKSELLRRKDLKIRQELEEKQNLIADILNIPRQDFESVADMAGEVGLSNKEPKELVLGAIYQAKKLQETLNEAQTVRETDVIAAQAGPDARGSLPLYNSSMDTMDKLLDISGTLIQFLNSLMIIVSERDEERDRMRKELVASRERVHQLHMQQNFVDQSSCLDSLPGGSSAPSQPPPSAAPPPTIETTSPHSSRPNSFVSVNSSVADHSDTTDQHNTDEEGKSDDPANSSTTEAQSSSDAPTEKGEDEACEPCSAPEDDEASRTGPTATRPAEGGGAT